MKVRVAVLGSTGMLGHVVARELEVDPNFEVKRFCRPLIDAMRPETIERILDVHYVINCIGLIKQLTVADRRDWYTTNAIFPYLLRKRCQSIGAKLIHVSTDCVFSGAQGNYSEDSTPDASDDYGFSKLCGEPADAMVLRTSIIGHELKTRVSLLEWAISQAGSQVNGYTNHVWNGVTSIEYANVCRKIMLNDLWKRGLYHIHSNSITKYELIKIINDAFHLRLDIVPHHTPGCNRALTTIHALNGLLKIPTVSEMVSNLARA